MLVGMGSFRRCDWEVLGIGWGWEWKRGVWGWFVGFVLEVEWMVSLLNNVGNRGKC